MNIPTITRITITPNPSGLSRRGVELDLTIEEHLALLKFYLASSIPYYLVIDERIRLIKSANGETDDLGDFQTVQLDRELLNTLGITQL